MKKKLYLTMFVFFMFALTTFAQTTDEKPYNPTANAKADIVTAVAQAAKEKKHVIIQVGGNWCPWCVKFHKFAKTEPKVDSVLKANYVYILVNYSKDNKNVEVMKQLENPGRFGYPVFVILDGKGKRIHTQDSGLLEAGKDYDVNKVVTFLKNWSPAAVNAPLK